MCTCMSMCVLLSLLLSRARVLHACMRWYLNVAYADTDTDTDTDTDM